MVFTVSTSDDIDRGARRRAAVTAVLETREAAEAEAVRLSGHHYARGTACAHVTHSPHVWVDVVGQGWRTLAEWVDEWLNAPGPQPGAVAVVASGDNWRRDVPFLLRTYEYQEAAQEAVKVAIRAAGRPAAALEAFNA